jgi:polysaccharide export outer membrane protein
MTARSGFWVFFALACAAAAPGCTSLPGSGFLRADAEPGTREPRLEGIQIVDVNDAITRQLLARRTTKMFSETLGAAAAEERLIGAGDTLEVNIWEAPPSTLFSPGVIDPKLGPLTSRVTTLPEQMVNKDGFISVPFAGQIRAAGRSVSEIETEITRRLLRKANQPQVLVRLTRNTSSKVTVVGEVTNSTILPLTPRGERLLDALAASGGVKQPISKMTIQITRGTSVYSLPLDTIIRDPTQNVPLQPGDVVTALFNPFSFNALGATGKNEEINFEAQGISLAQALARASGLNDNRADPQAIFIFRFEPRDTLDWPRQPVAVTPEGNVPVIYRLNLRDPRSFFVSQSFPVNNKDVLYVANAPAAELQKFLNLVFSVIYPITAANTVFRPD